MFITSNPALINALANNPEIRYTIEPGSMRVDSSAVVTDPRNVVLASEHGYVLFLWKAPDVYEGHVAFLDAGRGAAALAACREALEALWRHRGPVDVHGKVPLALREARYLCRRLGFRSTGTGRGHEHFILKGARDGRLG